MTVNPVELPRAERSAPGAQQTDAASKDINLNMLLDIPVDVHVELGSTRATLKELLHLGPGAIIELDRLAGQPADIVVNGRLIGQGDVVVVNDTFGVRITKLVGIEERLESV